MSNAINVAIKDFQSLKSVKLEIVNGVNIITGKTNQGKSAVIRAIDSALFNLGDDSMVRGGKRYSVVSIDNGDHKMIFCRDSHGKNEKTSYQFDDGTVQKKVGRAQLPEVAKLFNIRDVRMQNSTKIKLNFWYQNDKPFLMDKTSGQLYEFLSLSSCDKYSKILKQMIVDMKVQEADINNVTTEIDTLKVINDRKEKFLKSNKGYDDVYTAIITASQEEKGLKDVANVIFRIDSCKSKIDDSKSKLGRVKSQLQSIPFDRVNGEYNDCISQSNSLGKVNEALVRVIKCSKLLKEAETRDVKASELLSTGEEFCNSAKTSLSGILAAEKVINSITPIISQVLASSESISKKKEQLSGIEGKIPKDLDSVKVGIDRLEKESVRLSKIAEVIERICSMEASGVILTEKLQSVNESLTNNLNNLESIKNELGVCPFCGKPFH